MTKKLESRPVGTNGNLRMIMKALGDGLNAIPGHFIELVFWLGASAAMEDVGFVVQEQRKEHGDLREDELDMLVALCWKMYLEKRDKAENAILHEKFKGRKDVN